MSHPPAGHNLADGGRPGRRGWLLLLAGTAWTATVALVVRSEVLLRRDPPDVRELVASARLTRQHASARYVIRAGDAVVGTLSSVVSGSREEEQLAYVVEGELHAPLAARLKGVVVASWDRRPERFVLDLDLGGTSHRLDGSRGADGMLFVRYLPPGASPDDALTWDLDAPLLAPGPLPLPAVPERAGAPSRGRIADPRGGDELEWSLAAPVQEELVVASRRRRVTRRSLRMGDMAATAWTDGGGLPVRIELPAGIVLELTEEGR